MSADLPPVGRKCANCGHAESRHNSLGYCRHQNRRDGECLCEHWADEIGEVLPDE